MFEEPSVLTRGTGGTGQSGLTISMYPHKVGWEWRNGHSIFAIPVVTVYSHRDLYIGSIFTLR